MLKSYPLVLIVSCLLPGSVLAFESIDDEQLSEAVGQTGVVISTSVDWVSQAVRIYDLNGVPSTIKPGYEFNSGALVLNGMGIKGCTNGVGATCTTTSNPTFNITVDASGGPGGATPLAKVAVAWDSGINKIRILLDKISIHNEQGGNATDVVDFATGYLDVLRPGVANPTIGIELGNELSGHMMTFTNANFGTLDFGQVLIRDKSDDTLNNRNVRFNFVMAGMDFSGATMDINASGLLINAPGLTAVDMTMTNISAGNITSTNMGTVGVVGMNLSNLNFTIAGKS